MSTRSTTSGFHWRIYLMEGALLGIFMVSACVATALLECPDSPLHAAMPSALLRRLIIGIAMGVTAFFLLRSGWARRTGAHMNPAVTLSVLRTGKLSRGDAAGYIAGQFLGAIAGVGLVRLLMGAWLANAAVNYAVTTPAGAGAAEAAWAWGAELVISFVLLGVLLGVNHFPRVIPYSPAIAGTLIAVYIVVEAPISGMSMNPARTIGSAVFAQNYAGLWIYFTAPPLGMLAAVELLAFLGRPHHHLCCKLVHHHEVDCHCKCDCLTRHARIDTPSPPERTDHVHAV